MYSRIISIVFVCLSASCAIQNEVVNNQTSTNIEDTKPCSFKITKYIGDIDPEVNNILYIDSLSKLTDHLKYKDHVKQKILNSKESNKFKERFRIIDKKENGTKYKVNIEVGINKSGSLRSVDITSSSCKSELDKLTLDIVENAGVYEPPNTILKTNYDAVYVYLKWTYNGSDI